MGLDVFFDKTIGGHVDLSKLPEAEKQQYLADWSQPGALVSMLNWYRGSKLVVPPPGITVPVPDWVLGAFPTITVPTLVIWGMNDSALLPIQLEGLDRLVEDLTVVTAARAWAISRRGKRASRSRRRFGTSSPEPARLSPA